MDLSYIADNSRNSYPRLGTADRKILHAHVSCLCEIRRQPSRRCDREALFLPDMEQFLSSASEWHRPLAVALAVVFAFAARTHRPDSRIIGECYVSLVRLD